MNSITLRTLSVNGVWLVLHVRLSRRPLPISVCRVDSFVTPFLRTPPNANLSGKKYWCFIGQTCPLGKFITRGRCDSLRLQRALASPTLGRSARRTAHKFTLTAPSTGARWGKVTALRARALVDRVQPAYAWTAATFVRFSHRRNLDACADAIGSADHVDGIAQRGRRQFVSVVSPWRNGGSGRCYGWSAMVVTLGFTGAGPDFRLVCVGLLWVGLVDAYWFFYPRVGALVADAGGPLVDLGGGGATNQWSPLVALRTGLAALPFRHLADVIDPTVL